MKTPCGSVRTLLGLMRARLGQTCWWCQEALRKALKQLDLTSVVIFTVGIDEFIWNSLEACQNIFTPSRWYLLWRLSQSFHYCQHSLSLLVPSFFLITINKFADPTFLRCHETFIVNRLLGITNNYHFCRFLQSSTLLSFIYYCIPKSK